MCGVRLTPLECLGSDAGKSGAGNSAAFFMSHIPLILACVWAQKGHAPASRFPLPASRFPLPASRFPLPASRFPLPASCGLWRMECL